MRHSEFRLTPTKKIFYKNFTQLKIFLHDPGSRGSLLFATLNPVRSLLYTIPELQEMLPENLFLAIFLAIFYTTKEVARNPALVPTLARNLTELTTRFFNGDFSNLTRRQSWRRCCGSQNYEPCHHSRTPLTGGPWTDPPSRGGIHKPS